MIDSLSESAWRRGWNETKKQWTNWPFVLISTVVSIALFLIGLFVLEWYWGVGLTVLPVIGVWVYETVSAPYMQRNETRKRVIKLQEGAIKKLNDERTKLKGKFFHSFDKEGYVTHQGHIIDFVNDDIAVIQYFDWIIGEPSQTKMVWLRDIVEGGWALYSSAEEMRDAYDYGHVKHKP